ncbi:MAG: magnesium transporter CorA family protein [Sphingomonas sp.]|nr:magnesium transporter CorA family protein [Sphingomonas sp.]
MPISSYLYDAEGRDQQVELSVETLSSLGDQRLLWIDIVGRDPAELRQVAQALALDPASLRNLLNAGSTRLDNFGKYIQLAVETAPAIVEAEGSARGNGARASQAHTRLDVLIDKAWLLTVHEGEVAFIDDFRSQDRAETMIGALTTHDFAASLLDMHLEGYFKEIARVEGFVDKLDEQALIRPSSKSLLGLRTLARVLFLVTHKKFDV